ncbi:MAG TPA: Spy/CpxP family protein refolding chaperone [Verrucomicrobiae bacterium]|nr:Spy/CpxP family protein refolding chaperone [Verrucomicrobiae bacterium]
MTDDQQTKVDAALKDFQSKAREMFQQGQPGEGDREKMMAARKQLNDGLLAQLKGVLNDDQYKKVEEALSRGPRGGGPGGQRGGLEQALKELNLTADQQAKLDPIIKAQQEKMRAMFEKMQSGNVDREAMGEERKKAHDEFMGQLKGVLTDEQYAKFEESSRRMGPPGGGRGGFGGPGGPREQGGSDANVTPRRPPSE